MKYKMIVLDIDGTVTNSQKKITPKTHDALIRAQAMGIKVVLASGRPTYGLAPIADQLELGKYGGYILAFNGGLIADWHTHEVVFSKALTEEQSDQVCRLAKKTKAALLTYKNRTILSDSPMDSYVQLESKTVKMPVEPVLDMDRSIDFPAVKFMLVGDGEYLATLEKEVKEELGDTFSVFRSEPYFLEIMAEGINKASSLEQLLTKLSLTKEEMVCCGDGYNDLSMIEYAGLGVAMANASQEVRDAADYITASNDEDGIAQVLEKFFFSQEGDKDETDRRIERR